MEAPKKLVENIVDKTCYINDRVYKPGETIMMAEDVKSPCFHPKGGEPIVEDSFSRRLDRVTALGKKAEADEEAKKEAEAKKKAEAEEKKEQAEAKKDK